MVEAMEGGQGVNDVPAHALSLELVGDLSGALLDDPHALRNRTSADHGSNELRKEAFVVIMRVLRCASAANPRNFE